MIPGGWFSGDSRGVWIWEVYTHTPAVRPRIGITFVDLFAPALVWSGLVAGWCWSGGWLVLVCAGLSWSGLVWSGLVWSGLCWSELVCAGLVWSVLVWSALCSPGQPCAGLCWSVLVWAGLGWSGGWWLGCTVPTVLYWL